MFCLHCNNLISKRKKKNCQFIILHISAAPGTWQTFQHALTPKKLKWFKIHFIIIVWLHKVCSNMFSLNFKNCEFIISSSILRHNNSDPIKSFTGSYITVVQEPRESFIFGHRTLWNIWKWHPSQWDNKQDAAPIM